MAQDVEVDRVGLILAAWHRPRIGRNCYVCCHAVLSARGNNRSLYPYRPRRHRRTPPLPRRARQGTLYALAAPHVDDPAVPADMRAASLLVDPARC
jgi:hypothetical protein